MIAPLPDLLIEPIVRARAGRGPRPRRRHHLAAPASPPTRGWRPSSPPAPTARVAGLACARLALAALDPDAPASRPCVADGDDVAAGDGASPASRPTPAPCCRPSASALNLLGRLSRRRHPDPRLRRARSTGPARASSTPARPRPACGRWRSTPCAAAAASTTASASTTPS